MGDDDSEVFDPDWHPFSSRAYNAVREIKPLYQAALGEFLVAFNSVEQTVYKLIGLRLRQLGLANFAEKIEPNSLSMALEILQALRKDFPGDFDFDFTRMKKLSEFRNRVAHGAFDTTVSFDKEGELVMGYKITPKKKHKGEPITPDQLKEQAALANDAYSEMVSTLISLKIVEAEKHLQSLPTE